MHVPQKKTYNIGFFTGRPRKGHVDKLKTMRESVSELQKLNDIVRMNEGAVENVNRINFMTKFINKKF